MTYTTAPLNTMKSIVSATWVDFIKELKLTVGQGKQEPHRLMYQDSYFKCLLVDGENEGFVKCLDSITGEEVNVLELVDKLLESANVKTTPQNTVVEQNTSISTVSTVEERRDNAVEVSVVKPRTTSRKRSKKQGE